MKDLLNRELIINAKENRYGMVIEQKQSRALKAELLNKVIDLITNEYDIEVRATSEGTFLMIPNNEEGVIPVILDIKMKPLDTDVDTLEDEYKQKQEAKAQKQKKKEDE